MDFHKFLLYCSVLLLPLPGLQAQSSATVYSTEGWSITVNVFRVGIVVTQDFNGANCTQGFNYNNVFEYSVNYSEPGHSTYNLQLTGGCIGGGGVNLNPANGTNATVQDYGHPGSTGTPCSQLNDEDFPCQTVDVLVSAPGITSRRVTVYPMTNSMALPIELSRFRLFPANNGGVRLKWQTERETASESFTVERSRDGIIWQSIGGVAAAGDSDHRTDYEFVDPNPLTGKNYYRLLATDLDGQFDYSDVLYADLRQTKLSVHPNPVQRELRIRSTDTPRVYDYRGNDLTSSLRIVRQGDELYTADVSVLPRGMYVVRAGEFTERFVRN